MTTDPDRSFTRERLPRNDSLSEALNEHLPTALEHIQAETDEAPKPGETGTEDEGLTTRFAIKLEKSCLHAAHILQLSAIR